MNDKKKVVVKFPVALVFLVVLLALCALYFTWAIYSHPKIDDNIITNITEISTSNAFFKDKIQKIPAKIEVVDPTANNLRSIGISTDTDKLDFGRMMVGMNVRKFITIRNRKEYASIVHVKFRGDIADMLYTPQKRFIIAEGEEKEIRLQANGVRLGVHEGEVDVITRSPRHKIVGKMFEIYGRITQATFRYSF